MNLWLQVKCVYFIGKAVYVYCIIVRNTLLLLKIIIFFYFYYFLNVLEYIETFH